MAIAFGADLGFGASSDASDGTTVAFNTTATVASGGKLIVCVCCYNTVSVTVAGGGLTWTTDYAIAGTSDANRRIMLCSANAPAGLSSGTTLTATYSGLAFARVIWGSYFTGLATASYTDGSQKGEYDGNATWETVTLNTTNADDLLIAACWGDGGPYTNTPTAPWTEINDNVGAGPNISTTSQYRIVSSTGGYTGNGTWSSDVFWTAIIGAYKSGAPPTTYALATHNVTPLAWRT